MDDEGTREQAFLIARGVRALAHLGSCKADPLAMLEVASRIERLGEAGAIPFVLDRGDGTAVYGYAASKWVLDLYRWLNEATAVGVIPHAHRCQIIGLLHGYGIEAIRRFTEQESGRLFQGPMNAPTSCQETS